mgnify:CR=1 FL=1
MVIAQRLGHSSIEEISTRYGHLYPSTQKDIVKYFWVSLECRFEG